MRPPDRVSGGLFHPNYANTLLLYVHLILEETMLVNFPPTPPETQSFGQVPNGRGPEWWVVSPNPPVRQRF